MKSFKIQTATAIAATLLALPAFGQTSSNQSGTAGGSSQTRNESSASSSQDAEAALKQVAEQRKQEMEAQGSRKVEVQEKAIWGLGELPPKLMTKACEQLAEDADKAKLSVMQAANILELTASIGKDSGEARQLIEQANQLREIAMKIETREIISRDQLKQPFAKASLAAAKYYEAAARNGLQKNDEEQTGYTLMGAAGYLTAAHVFAEQKPSAEVSRAAYDANVTAEQIVKLSKNTTIKPEGMQMTGNRGQDEQGSVQGSADNSTQRRMERDRQASGNTGSDNASNSGSSNSSNQKQDDKANIPNGTEQVVENLKKAIDSVQLSSADENTRSTNSR